MAALDQPYHPQNFPVHLRAADSQREAVATEVRAALAEGRLDINELDDRLTAVYAAKTHGDLAAVIVDLVPTPPGPNPSSAVIAPPPSTVSDRAILPAFLLCLTFGIFGAHRFYTGPTKTGVIRLALPFTGIGAPVAVVWALSDLVVLAIGRFKDGDGRTMRDWT